MLGFAVLILLLTFATQRVFCFFHINYSTPDQCGPFVVNFSGSTIPPQLPLSLTIVPISANPISILLPADTWDNSSNAGTARITFLPFSSGTQFVASLDDGTGSSVGFVSDVIAVKNSNITTCLAPKQKGTDFYQMHGDMSQCSRFNLTFDPSVIRQAPSIRAFLPRYFSFPVNATDTPITTIMLGGHFNSTHKNNKRDNNDGDSSVDDGNGDDDDGEDDDGDSDNNKNFTAHNISSKEYILDIVHGYQAVLSFDDGEGHRESSKLFTASGTSSSSSNCFKENFNLPSQSANTSSSSTSREPVDSLSRTGKIVVSVLSASVAISLAVILSILCRRQLRKKKDAEKLSFVFTEDVDMGSSFVSLASRIRARISQLTYGKRSYRSYRSYRDEKDGASNWVPTSPIGSLAPLSSWNASLPRSEKSSSWLGIDKGTGDFIETGSESSSRNSRIMMEAEGHRFITPPSIEFNSLAPHFPAEVHTRSSKPDVPLPAISRSSESSRFVLGSGYLSTRSSGIATPPQNNGLHGPSKRSSASLTRTGSSAGRQSSVVVLSSDFSFSEYVSSRSSAATSEPGDSGIYISSPKRPSLDLPHRVSSDFDESGLKIPPPSATQAVALGIPRYSVSTGNLRLEGPRRDRARILPFPIVSLRASRTSQ